MLLVDVMFFLGIKGNHQAEGVGVVNDIPVRIRRRSYMDLFDLQLNHFD